MRYNKKQIKDFLDANIHTNLYDEKMLAMPVKVTVTSFREGLKVSELFGEFVIKAHTYFYLYTYNEECLRELHKLKLRTLTLTKDS